MFVYIRVAKLYEQYGRFKGKVIPEVSAQRELVSNFTFLLMFSFFLLLFFFHFFIFFSLLKFKVFSYK